ncbi:PPE family protein [Mycobacterium kansasii]|uniref:PPE family protein n=1 Tax=Mycobacterium kansasii TaxID=1768 RepID=A0A1V3WI76_MYCKA|nr:PPE family protein [Mycobacterium kansasii]
MVAAGDQFGADLCWCWGGPLFAAASAWAGLAAELAGWASSFDAVIAGLTGGPWAVRRRCRWRRRRRRMWGG